MFLPEVTFKYSKGDTWVDIDTHHLFDRKRSVVFSLPGAFTPTCTTRQLPAYDELYPEFMKYVNEVYCIYVNDSFVMNQWFSQVKVQNVKPIPDGACEFTSAMGMAVNKANFGFGYRSWRYAMVVNNGEIERIFEEPGKVGLCPADPYSVSSPQTVLNYLQEQ